MFFTSQCNKWHVIWTNTESLTAVRNRLRSQKPPTRFHTFICCLLTLPLVLILFDSSPYWGYPHHPPAPRDITILTHAMQGQLICVVRCSVWIVTNLCQTDAAVRLWHLNLIVSQMVKILHCLLSCCSDSFISCQPKGKFVLPASGGGIKLQT